MSALASGACAPKSGDKSRPVCSVPPSEKGHWPWRRRQRWEAYSRGNMSATELRRRFPIARDAENGAAGGVYSNDALAQLTKDYPDVFLPGWSASQCRDEREMESFRPAIIEKLFVQVPPAS
jgi:hypothetical protein